MKQAAAFQGGYIEPGRFNRKFEATSKQTGYINSLCRQLGIELETAHERLFGMACVVAYTDRPWLCLTRREASALIDRLKAAIQAKEQSMRDAKTEAQYDEVQGSEPPHQNFDDEPLSSRIEAEEARREHYKAALTDDGPTDEQTRRAWRARTSCPF